MSFGSIGVSLAKESVKFQPSLSYTPSRNHPIVQGSKMILVMVSVLLLCQNKSDFVTDTFSNSSDGRRCLHSSLRFS